MKRFALLPVLTLVVLSLAPSAMATSKPSLDAQWLQTSIANDRFAIMAGKFAARHSSNGHLSALAGRIVSDHTIALKAASSLAREKGIEVPSRATPTMLWQLHMLTTLPDSRFAREYAASQVHAHADGVVLAGSEAQFGSDDEIRKLADHEANTLSKDMRLARQTLLGLA